MQALSSPISGSVGWLPHLQIAASAPWLFPDVRGRNQQVHTVASGVLARCRGVACEVVSWPSSPASSSPRDAPDSVHTLESRHAPLDALRCVQDSLFASVFPSNTMCTAGTVCSAKICRYRYHLTPPCPVATHECRRRDDAKKAMLECVSLQNYKGAAQWDRQGVCCPVVAHTQQELGRRQRSVHASKQARAQTPSPDPLYHQENLKQPDFVANTTQPRFPFCYPPHTR